MDELFEFLCKLGIDDPSQCHLARDMLEVVHADKPSGNRWPLTPEMKATVRMFLREKGWLDRPPAEDAGDVRVKLPSGYRCAPLANQYLV